MGKKQVKKEIINSCRSYLIRSAGADEQRAIIALSKMYPRKFNSNSHFYEYSGVYFYPMGLFFCVLSKIKLLTLTSDMAFYFLNPDEIEKLYLSGRIFGTIGTLLFIVVFHFLCRELFIYKKLVYFLTLFYGAVTGSVLWFYYLKSFSYGTFWLILVLWTIERYLYFSIVFTGLSFGRLLIYGYITICFHIYSVFGQKLQMETEKSIFYTCNFFSNIFYNRPLCFPIPQRVYTKDSISTRVLVQEYIYECLEGLCL